MSGLSFLFFATVFHACRAQVLELFSQAPDGFSDKGEGPFKYCPVDMNTTYPSDGYCGDVVNYRHCPAWPVPQPNSDNVDYIYGQAWLDAAAKGAYERIMSSVLTKHSSTSDSCRTTARQLACYYVYAKASDDWSRLTWNTPCRSVCYEIKNNCWVQEQCQEIPAGGCTARSGGSALRPAMLALTGAAVLLVLSLVGSL